MGETVTFAVVGHDEEATVGAVLDEVTAAARPGDRIWFVDSASADGSAAVARARGAEVVTAPLGKGRAVAAAVERWQAGTAWLCLVDADTEWSERSIPAVLRTAADGTAADGTAADMVVGAYDEPARRRVVTPYVYRPLVAALFPDVVGVGQPLSGFRLLRRGIAVGPLPPGYGVETHLNLEVPLAGHTVQVVPLGAYRGPLRGYTNVPAIAADVGAAILDCAVRHRRLASGVRPAWERWLGAVVDAVADRATAERDPDGHEQAVQALAARPLPPTH